MYVWISHSLLEKENCERIHVLPLIVEWKLQFAFLISIARGLQINKTVKNEMALNTSSWLNQCFVEKILRKSESDNSIQVIDIFSNPGSNKGDNYLCDIIRITAEFSREQSGHKIVEKKSIIVKVSPTSESIRYNI
ncbi:PREDICTED: uncharacterized protein LOC105460952, partial [Wasmannia auropunctata]|uniref:uncharacterized protein LOC105460952 n=1 Tax=Wasmannia auropunctata TaxID=64793 RepID=UPI0005EEFF5E